VKALVPDSDRKKEFPRRNSSPGPTGRRRTPSPSPSRSSGRTGSEKNHWKKKTGARISIIDSDVEETGESTGLDSGDSDGQPVLLRNEH
jgi:hypothetical protein